MHNAIKSFSLTVVIPNRNRIVNLIRAVLSVLRQSDEGIEIIIVDDCSSEALSRHYDLLAGMGAKVLRLPHPCGASFARNVGIKAATGAYVSFLDSDDVWLPGRLDRFRRFAERANASRQALVSGIMLHIRPGELVTFNQPPWPAGGTPVDFIYRAGGRIQTSLLTVPLPIARAHPFREKLRVNQDSDFVIRLGKAGVDFVIDSEPGVIKNESASADRLSLDPNTTDLSLAWFKSVSGDWSAAAINGYYLRDRVWRLANSGRRAEALACLVRANLPPVAMVESLRMGGELLLSRQAYSRVQQIFRHIAPKKHRVDNNDPAAIWLHMIDAEAQVLSSSGSSSQNGIESRGHAVLKAEALPSTPSNVTS